MRYIIIPLIVVCLLVNCFRSVRQSTIETIALRNAHMFVSIVNAGTSQNVGWSDNIDDVAAQVKRGMCPPTDSPYRDMVFRYDLDLNVDWKGFVEYDPSTRTARLLKTYPNHPVRARSLMRPRYIL
jgi:hypothetical protein